MYRIITDGNPQNVEARVNDLMKQGYEPCGGLVVNSGNHALSQAMVKRPEMKLAAARLESTETKEPSWLKPLLSEILGKKANAKRE